MQLRFVDKQTNGTFVMYRRAETLKGGGIQCAPNTFNTFVWNNHDDQQVWIDEVAYTFPARSMLPLTSTQHFRFEWPEKLIAWQFNREFYCILNHDKEVGCVGFLFYGIQTPLFIELDEKDTGAFAILEEILSEEFQEADNFQGEMLRSLLKRLIIKATRLGKSQAEAYELYPDEKLDLVRNFALLVEIHFRKEHEVQFYAQAMNKSPKTLSNLFALYKQPSPLKVIHDRIILEAKRLFFYTDKSAKEVAFELGFDNPEHFSRFFKQKTGSSASVFRKKGSGPSLALPHSDH